MGTALRGPGREHARLSVGALQLPIHASAILTLRREDIFTGGDGEEGLLRDASAVVLAVGMGMMRSVEGKKGGRGGWGHDA